MSKDEKYTKVPNNVVPYNKLGDKRASYYGYLKGYMQTHGDIVNFNVVDDWKDLREHYKFPKPNVTK